MRATVCRQAAVAVAGLLVAACGAASGSSPAPVATPAPPLASPRAGLSPSPAVAKVEVVKDVVYQSVPGSTDPNATKRLDIYAPTGRQGGPAVVLFHGAGYSKDGDREAAPGAPYILAEMAKALAARGAVAFVATWRNFVYDAPPLAAEAMRAQFSEDADAGACAAAYALVHAREYGADPDTLVLFGHSAGSNVAAMTGLTERGPLPGCAVPLAPFTADGLVLWEGNWLLSEDGYDDYGASLPTLLEAFTPWAHLATAPRVPVDLVTTRGMRRAAYRMVWSADADGGYLALRDPDGSLRLAERFASIGATDDREIDAGEVDQVLGAAMREAGLDAAVIQLEHGDHGGLDEDQPLVVDEILAIADR